MTPEQIYLGSCLLESTLIDKGVQEGIKADHFTTTERSAIWSGILGLHMGGKDIGAEALFLELGKGCPMEEIFACEAAAPTQANGTKSLKRVLEAYNLQSLKPALQGILSKIEGSSPYEDIESSLEALPALLRDSGTQEHSLEEIVKEADSWIDSQLSGDVDTRKNVILGLPHLDDAITSIQRHEYVIVGARPSTGKTSLITHIAGTNVERGLTVAYFTLETTGRSIVLQIAAQRVGVNLKQLRHEFDPQQKKFREEVERIGTQNLILFEHDMTLEAIESRCRLLKASSTPPDLVCIDYLGLIKVKGSSPYERMSLASKAMIPLRKSLDCTLILAGQLNRGSAIDNRAPVVSDFRDAGGIEEDAHRVLLVHRPLKDDGGNEQSYDQVEFQQEILQAKLRDGPLAQGRVLFKATHTKFTER
tara:strand:+ start:1014 stop:2273 length:1260 start_codon:yes stop_codon:yes gene_type:complete